MLSKLRKRMLREGGEKMSAGTWEATSAGEWIYRVNGEAVGCCLFDGGKWRVHCEDPRVQGTSLDRDRDLGTALLLSEATFIVEDAWARWTRK